MSENPLIDWELQREKLVVKRILDSGLEFTLENVVAIVHEMSYATQSKKHPEDCPCYSSKPCHTNIADLNCLLCNCPQYDSYKKDEDQEFTGGCKINSRKGKWQIPYPSPAGKVWDCSSCIAYHSPRVIEIYLRQNLEKYKKIAEKIKG